MIKLGILATAVITPLFKVFKWASILSAFKGFFSGNPIDSIGNAIKATLFHMAADNSEKWRKASNPEELKQALSKIALNVMGLGVLEFGQQSYKNKGRALKFAPDSVVNSTRGVLKSFIDPLQHSLKAVLFSRHKAPTMQDFKLDPSLAQKLDDQVPLD